MLEVLGENLTSLICDLSLEKANNILADQQDRKLLLNRINEQIKRYEKDNLENLGEDEQFDFEKANQYIKEHLFDKVCACFNLPEIYQREIARKNLIDSVYDKAGADTIGKKRAVYHYLQIFLQIVKAFYIEKIGDKEWFLAGQTLEEATALVNQYIKASENRIVDAVRYHGSFAEYIDGIKQEQDNVNAFHYRNELLKFRGREAELKMLSEFIESDEELSWIAITGSGGVGKSKLLYYFVKVMRINPKWKSVWVHSENCRQFTGFTEWRYPCNLLIVVDYAGTMASDMGKWLECLEQSAYHPDKMRFVFIEREGIEENGNVPLWYQNLKGSGEQARCVERLGWKKYNGTPFFQLPELEYDKLEKIIEDYAETRNKVLSAEQRKWILEKAEEIDRRRGNPRVLIVIFTADAVLEGREYKHWDIQHLIDEIIKKYSEHWKEVICRNNEKIFNALSEMLMFATVAGAWAPEDTVPELFADSASTLCSMDSDDLEQLICEVNEEKQFEGKLKPLEPDLIGEYFVLDYWAKKKYARDYLANIFCILWKYPLHFVQFLNRCIQNYAKQNTFQFLLQNGMERLSPPENNELGTLLFSMLLVNLIVNQTESGAEESVRRLEELSGKHEGNEEIALSYANGLFNLLCGQEESGAKESVRCLEELSGKHEGNEEIVLRYAQGLVNLSNKQGEEGAKESVQRLEELSGKHEGNEEIALTYAKGLFNLLYGQEESGAKESVQRLEELSGKHEGNEKIALSYAQGLVNLSNKQEEAGAKESVRRLEELSGKHEGNEEIALAYAKGLVNLSNKQEEEGAEESARRLEELSGKHEGNEEIALRYAKGLVNLLNKQEEGGAEESARRLEELSGKHEGNEEIALRYAEGLVNLSNKQEEEGAEESIRRLEELSGKHEGNEEIAFIYAIGLVKLSGKQEKGGAEESIRRLDEVRKKYDQIDKWFTEFLEN